MPPPATIPFGTPGEIWPSGRSKVAALIDVSDAWVAEIFDMPLLGGFEDGLGPWVGSGGRLKSGAMVELVRYEHGNKGLFEVRFDHEVDAQSLLDEFMAVTNLGHEALKWKQPEA